NFVTTTTMPELHAENETRIWTILVDDSPRTTRGVLAVQARKALGAFRPCDGGDLRAAFEWLKSAGAKEAVVPLPGPPAPPPPRPPRRGDARPPPPHPPRLPAASATDQGLCPSSPATEAS